MTGPQIRLALRALLAALLSLAVQLQQNAAWDNAVIRSAIIGAVLAALEVFTPVNAVVGPGKTETVHKLPRKAKK